MNDGGSGSPAGKGAPSISQVEDGWLVSIPTAGGLVRFLATGLEQPKRHVLDAEFRTWVEAPGEPLDPFEGHLNLLSLSSRDSYRRQLDEQFKAGKGYWTNLLNRACQMITQAWEEMDWSVDLRGVEASERPRYLLHPLVHEGLPTVLFGAGGVGKSYLALALARAVIEGGEFLGAQAQEMGPVLYVDYEARARDIKRRLLRLGLPEERHGGLIYWPGMGPLASQVRAMRRAVAERGVRLVIVDSAALACGGDPKEEHVATAYFNALAAVGVASLTIAHVSKEDAVTEQRRPYGSIYWENCARSTWRVKEAEGDGDGVKRLGLYNIKPNEDRRHRPIGVRMVFGEASVTVEREELAEELMEGLPVRARVRSLLLRRGKMTVAQIAEELGAGEAAVRKALQRMADAFHEGDRGRGNEGVWMIMADRDGDGR